MTTPLTILDKLPALTAGNEANIRCIALTLAVQCTPGNAEAILVNATKFQKYISGTTGSGKPSVAPKQTKATAKA